MNYIKKMIL